MSHANYVKVNVKEVLATEPIAPSKKLQLFFGAALTVGIITFFAGLLVADGKRLWGAFYVNTLFWTGLGFGGLVTALIFQIVRAKWAATLRRISEANIAFIPWTLLALLLTYMGKNYLFPWATAPMPGREFWMQPNFVYVRFFLMFGFLFLLFKIYVRHSLRSDAGYISEQEEYKSNWKSALSKCLLKNWKGSENEIKPLQVKMSCLAPFIVFVYVVVYSLFAFEMIMGMDTVWFSNMFGGFNFVGNISMGWAALALTVIYLSSYSKDFDKVVNKDQLWDLGKLQFGFTMLWGYLFFSQYLPQWYGNMPEETVWLLTRVRGEWMPLSYFVFSCCFVIPFILLLSEDLKKTPWAYAGTVLIILTGYWFEKYVTVMPQLFPDEIPLKHGFLLELGLFLGFLGTYGLSIQSFLKKYPYIPVSHPITVGSRDW